MNLTEAQKTQGSPEWHMLRLQCVTATDIVCLMGASDYLTPYELWQLKLGFREPEKNSGAMQLGHDYEEVIRKKAEENFNCVFQPDVVIHPEIPFVLASLDGVDYTKEITFEAKVCDKETFEKVKNNEIPYKFYVQCQIGMACTGLHLCVLGAHNPSYRDFAFQTILRDQSEIDKYLEAAKSFKFCVDNLVAPNFTEKDMVPIEETEELKSIVHEYVECRHFLSTFQDIEKRLKNEIVERAGKRNASGCGIKVIKVTKRGSINYEKLFQDLKVDTKLINSYRNEDTEYFKIMEVEICESL